MSVTVTPKARRRRRWPWFAGGACLLVLIGAVLAMGQKGQTKSGRSVSPDDFDLRLGKAEIADIQVAVNEVGAIEPTVKVDVKSTLSGKVTDLLVREGERVVRGQVLARVEPDVNQAQTLSAVRSGMNLAQIQAENATKDLDRNKRLHEEGYISDMSLKDFQLKFDTTLEDLAAARTRMRIVEESGVPIEGQISTTQRVNIVSPMDGCVIKKNVEVGQTVTSGVSSFNEGTALYTVADVNTMLIKAAINEVDIGRVRLGMPVRITVDAFPYRKFDGTVTHISPAARMKERVKVFDVEVTLARQTPEFRAGMTANIEVLGDRVEKTLSAPVEAVFRKDGRQVVYALKKSFDEPKAGERKPRKLKTGKLDVSDCWQRFFEERDVEVGLAGLERAQVLKGLTAGTEVALEDPTRPRRVDEE
jgi:HlyD family secretion protein